MIEIKGIKYKNNLIPSQRPHGIKKIKIFGKINIRKIEKTLKQKPLNFFLKYVPILKKKQINNKKLKMMNSGIL